MSTGAEPYASVQLTKAEAEYLLELVRAAADDPEEERIVQAMVVGEKLYRAVRAAR